MEMLITLSYKNGNLVNGPA